jgi:hypothetical protein
MADIKISQLPAATTPLTGSEQIPLVQGGITKRATVVEINPTQTLQTVTTNGAITTVNSQFNGANIGTFSGVPAVTSTGTTVGFANSTNAAILIADAWRGTSNNNINLGASGYNWNNVYGTTYNVGSGTANITASGNNVVLNAVVAAVPGTGFAPVTNNLYYLGGSLFKWKSLYLGDGDINWNSYAIPAPVGGTTTFLRNDGTWATPAGSGFGSVTSVAVSGGTTGLTTSGGPVTTSGTITLAGTLANTNGGTGATAAFTQYGITYASSTTVLATTAAGTSTTVLHGNASGAPTFGAVSLTADVSGTLPNTSGGTGQSSAFTQYGVTYASTTTALATTAAGTAGYVLTANSGAAPTFQAPAAGFSTAANNTFTGTQTFNGSSSIFGTVLLDSAETVNVVASAPSSTTNFYVQSGSVQYYTSNAANNWTLNVAFSSGTSMNTALAIGQSVTFVLVTTQGSTAYYNSAVTIDGTSVTPKWIGGAPTAGNASGLDVYRYAVVKTASATYTVLASLTQYK